jgi:hypothetical protein
MTDPEDRPEKWRQRAAELRAIADQFSHEAAREDLMQLAGQWERMAERQEQRNKARTPQHH